MDQTKRPQQGVNAVEIGIRIASTLAHAGTSLPLGELAQLSGLPPSKAHRYLVSLCRSGLIEQDPQSGRYDLGHEAVLLGLEAQSRLDEFKRLDDTLRDLFESCHQPLAVMTWGGKGPVIVRRLEPVQPIIVSARIGATLSVVGPASGTLFAAFLPNETVGPIINDEYSAKNKPPIPRRDFMKLVELARRHRLTSTTGGYIRGFDALAAPVFNSLGEISMTISMLAPTGTADFDFDGELAHMLREASDGLSRRLGFRERPGALRTR
ncbi:MAG: IclR family transcriptional regulator [Gammaproteobacteria bacterium]|nr:IclR family transcriptional regulator [Gammaproteobacteria bacterium]